MTSPRESLARNVIEGLPFCRALDMVVESAGPGTATLVLPWSSRIVGDPANSVLHGGVVTALLDSCGGAAVLLHPENGAPTATIDLRIDYMRSAIPGARIQATAEVYHVTSTVAFVRGLARDNDPSTPVAAATAAYTFAHVDATAFTPTSVPRADADVPEAAPGSQGDPEFPGVLARPDHAVDASGFDGIRTDWPYLDFMGITFDIHGNELTAVMKFHPKLIGNSALPALHGGATAGFLEAAAIIEISWERGLLSAGLPGKQPTTADAVRENGGSSLRLPKTIDFSVDYLRPGRAEDCFARARVIRSGRRYASVHVEAWQSRRDRLIAQATGHFLIPQPHG